MFVFDKDALETSVTHTTHITNTIASPQSQLTRSASGYQPIFASMCSARIVIPRLVGGVIGHLQTRI